MAKLGSSSCRPLVQGMMLLALLLSSIQAAKGGVLETGIKKGGEILHGAFEKLKGGEFLHDDEVEKLPDQLAKTFLASRFCQKPAMARFCKGGKMGLRVHKYLCKAQDWMDKQNPGGTPLDIIGGLSFPTFYDVTVTSQGRGNSVVTCWSAVQPQGPAAGTTPTTSSTLVQIRSIRVGLVDIPVQTPAYLSNTQPAYTYLDSRMYSLRKAVSWEMQSLNPWATPIADELCYVSAAPLRLPRIAILLASGNGLWNCS